MGLCFQVVSNGIPVMVIHDFGESGWNAIWWNQTAQRDDGQDRVSVRCARHHEARVVCSGAKMIGTCPDGHAGAMAFRAVVIHGQGSQDASSHAERAFDGLPAVISEPVGFPDGVCVADL